MCDDTHFLTIYRKDYVPKKFNTKKPKEINEHHKWKYVEFKNPINEGFKQYLCLDPCEEEDKYSEDADPYFDKAIEKYPAFEFQTKNEPIDKEAIRLDRIFDGRSVYQADYCDLVREVAEKEYAKKTAIRLPMDVYIRQTTQRASYRLPITINSKAYVRETAPRPKNSLDPNYKLREILEVKTGETDYGAIIGKLGDRIVLEQLHGYIPKL